ncbi:MAG: hypothetical protein KKD35_06470 [Elusimicrobia bacterium]|nr:hypothetical protein [Elusimicrobiota bacterium]
MAKIVLIPCVKEKLDYKAKASDLYIGALFKKLFEFAKSLSPDKIFILSGKYGLLELDDEIEPYDKNLNLCNVEEIIAWSDEVIGKLGKLADLNNDEFVFVVGTNYRKFIIPSIKKSIFLIPQGLTSQEIEDLK